MDNENYTEYDDKKNRIPWLRMIITAIVIVLIIFIVLFIIKKCSKTSLRRDVIEAAQSYYEKYPTKLPKEIGECYIVTLDTLESEGLIDSNKYSTCDKTKTYVNVCYLENLEYNYAATLSCEVETTIYGIWKDGSVSDLTENSDVRFRFFGEQYALVDEETNLIGEKYYYPNNESNESLVNTYYANEPSSEYTYKEKETEGYKWYTESTVKSYWNNGEYSATAPSGYVNKDSQNKITKYSTTKPETASYRTIETTTLYRYKRIAAPYKFVCVVPSATNDSNAIISPYHCSLNESGFTKVWKTYYSCDNGVTPKEYGTLCEDFKEYTEQACTTNYTKGIICESITGYKYTDVVYKWYKNITVKKYYPSGASTSSGENTYYISSPISGAVRDDSTQSQVYKYYKTSTNGNIVEKWIEVTDGYVSLSELISTFNTLGYEVNSLSDINALENIRYQVKMQYRNVEE